MDLETPTGAIKYDPNVNQFMRIVNVKNPKPKNSNNVSVLHMNIDEHSSPSESIENIGKMTSMEFKL